MKLHALILAILQILTVTREVLSKLKGPLRCKENIINPSDTDPNVHLVPELNYPDWIIPLPFVGDLFIVEQCMDFKASKKNYIFLQINIYDGDFIIIGTLEPSYETTGDCEGNTAAGFQMRCMSWTTIAEQRCINAVISKTAPPLTDHKITFKIQLGSVEDEKTTNCIALWPVYMADETVFKNVDLDDPRPREDFEAHREEGITLDCELYKIYSCVLTSLTILLFWSVCLPQPIFNLQAELEEYVAVFENIYKYKEELKWPSARNPVEEEEKEEEESYHVPDADRHVLY